MCCVHNVLIRGINSIYKQAPYVQPADFKAFVGFALSWYKIVHHHHRSEEEHFFDEVDKSFGKGVMSQCLQEHEAFHEGLDKYNTYLTSLSRTEHKFSGPALQKIIDDFAPALGLHLKHEIDILMGLHRFDDEALVSSLWDKAVAAGIKDLSFSSFVEDIPFYLLNHDLTFEGGIHTNFPPFPPPVRFIMSHVLTLWHWNWWRFAACNTSGRPQALYALPGTL
jgi:hypothetical protein